MKKIPYACLYPGYYEAYSTLSDAQFGALIRGLLYYMNYDEDPKLTGLAKHFWLGLRQQFQRDAQAYYDRVEISRKNGAKGGRPKAEETQKPVGFESPQIKTQKPNENDNYNENKNKNDSYNENDNENERNNGEGGLLASPRAPMLTPPDAKAVQLYCLEAGLDIDPNRFVDYYASTGWMRKGTPIRDWKAAARCWASREPEDS